MIVLEVELGVLIVCLAAAMVFGWRMWRDVLAKIIDREKALDLHVKSVSREAMKVTNEARKTLEAAQNTLGEAQGRRSP